MFRPEDGDTRLEVLAASVTRADIEGAYQRNGPTSPRDRMNSLMFPAGVLGYLLFFYGSAQRQRA